MKTLQVDDLIMRGLVTHKNYTINGITTALLKYHRKVFYNNLWSTDDRLLECRGTVIDELGNILVLPFKKVFNYLENGTTCNHEKDVTIIQKMNGFMAAFTNVNGKPIVSTTGSLSSDHVKLAAKMLKENGCIPNKKGVTYIFEICSPEDPHIIDEEAGIYLIGMRYHGDGSMASEASLDATAQLANWKRPTWIVAPFRQALKAIKYCKHEGYMVRGMGTAGHICKLKSPHYLSKKAIMRLGKEKVDAMYEDPKKLKERIDEEFYGVIDQIVQEFSVDEWKIMSDQERRSYIEDYFS